MSQPRRILPKSTYLITRRTLRRHFLLRPDEAISRLIVYVLAVSSRRFGIEVHAFCAMSTHLHLVVTDVDGALPRFLQFFHRIVALGIKVLRKWEGPVWEPGAVSVVHLTTRAAVVEKIAYVLANPVAAGLVPYAHEWPGARTTVDEIARAERRERRPTVYLDPENPNWPEEAILALSLPPIIEKEAAEGFRLEVSAELGRLEVEARAEVAARGLRFLGAKGATQASPYDRATSFEPLRGCHPTFAVGREQGGAWRAAAGAVRAFRACYRGALERWRAGVREAVFPVGTWWMRVFHGAEVNDVVLAV